MSCKTELLSTLLELALIRVFFYVHVATMSLSVHRKEILLSDWVDVTTGTFPAHMIICAGFVMYSLKKHAYQNKYVFPGHTNILFSNVSL